jgi:hypothetical protein
MVVSTLSAIQGVESVTFLTGQKTKCFNKNRKASMQIAVEKVKSAGRLLEVDDQTFRAQFNQSCFMVSHQLAGHPLFEFDRLFQLLKKADKSKLIWDMGDIKVNQKWNEIKAGNLSVEEAFSRIENSGAWMTFPSIQRDPEYKALLDDYLAEVEDRCSMDSKRYFKFKDAIIFVASPRRVTTYHIDRECSFLLQIRGDKTIYIHDKSDRTVLTEEELEQYWTVNNNSATFKEQYQDRAKACHLAPGIGVHLPVGAPHWVKNGDNVSISLNINMHFHDMYRGNIYRANHYLRKAGLNPTPPGQSKAKDAIKGRVMHCLVSARRILQGRSLPISPAQTRKHGTPWK